MSRTALTVTAVPAGYAAAGVAVTFAAAAISPTFNSFVSTGREILIAQNTDSGAQTVTIHSTADPEGRTGDITTETIAAGAFHVFQEFPQNGWVQSDGLIYVDASAATIKFAVLRLP